MISTHTAVSGAAGMLATERESAHIVNDAVCGVNDRWA
jgi:hypothetical protein